MTFGRMPYRALLLFAAVAVPLAVVACGGQLDPNDPIATTPTAANVTTPSKPTRPAQQPLPDPDEEEENPNVCPSPQAITAEAIEKEVGSTFKGPAPRIAACSPVDLTTFQRNLTDPATQTFASLEQGLSEECVACVFTKASDEAWGPIVLLDQSFGPNTSGNGFMNLGACYASASGDPQCGRAVQYNEFCGQTACSDCLTSLTYSSCLAKVGQTTCKTSHDAVGAQCASEASGLCGPTIFEHVKYLCAFAE